MSNLFTPKGEAVTVTFTSSSRGNIKQVYPVNSALADIESHLNNDIRILSAVDGRSIVYTINKVIKQFENLGNVGVSEIPVFMVSFIQWVVSVEYILSKVETKYALENEELFQEGDIPNNLLMKATWIAVKSKLLEYIEEYYNTVPGYFKGIINTLDDEFLSLKDTVKEPAVVY